MIPTAGGGGVVRSQPMSTAVQCAHGAQINFGDLAPYLTYTAETCLCQITKIINTLRTHTLNIEWF
jgi:hypothetical protein